MTYSEAEKRLDDKDFRLYLLFWTWASYRASGQAGLKQDKYCTKRGYNALIARRNRFQQALNP